MPSGHVGLLAAQLTAGEGSRAGHRSLQRNLLGEIPAGRWECCLRWEALCQNPGILGHCLIFPRHLIKVSGKRGQLPQTER